MNKPATKLLGVLLLLCSPLVAHAADHYPPGPPYRTCTDSLLVYQIQQTDTTLAMCHPVNADTVLGVGGIVTGFDKTPTGFATYFQNHAYPEGNAPWTGIDAFTGGTNLAATMGLVLGDSIVVYGAIGDFAGETEILSPNNSFTTPNIIIRKVDSGHPLPAFHVGTVNELQELPTNPNAEQWEGCLVKVNGPMRVVRTSATGGMGQANGFLVVDNVVCPPGSLGPCDSMFVDGNTLSQPQYTPPSVGTLVDAVQGIYNQRSRGYRIQIRDGNDIVVATPPNLVDAFPVHDDTILVTFDRAITQSSIENTANYSLASFGTVVSATQVTPNTVVLDISNGLADGDNETVTVNGVVGAANGLAMTSPQNRAFFNGVMPISLIQAPDPAGLAAVPCVDRSLFAGPGSAVGGRLSFRGICTAGFGNLYYLQDGTTQRSGMSLFAPVAPLIVGHQFLVSGAVQEFFEETEGTSNVYLRDEGAATIPTPIDQSVGVISDTTCDAVSPQLRVQTHLTTGEDYEGMLVRLPYVMMTENRTSGQTFFVAGSIGSFADTILIGSGSFTVAADSGDMAIITGIVRFPFGSFRVAPRSDADIVTLGHGAGVGGGIPARVTFSTYPNPARSSRLVFGLPTRQAVDLGVFDLQGRQLATLARGVFEPGTYTRDWNGLTDSGQRAESGIYFYRLRAGSKSYVVRGVRIE